MTLLPSANRAVGMLMALTLIASTSLAAGPTRRSSSELLNQLRRLSVVGGALYVAAHPDDENTELLAYLANDLGVRTAYLSMTRGEGGQNLIGPELGPLLGVIRTQELLAARRIDGAEQYFTRARDFGFSKSVDETLSIWNHDAVLADTVRVIRQLRPDVIITRFSLEAGGTHGHHTASARIAAEAFKAAADQSFHPEQVKQFGTWQAKRLLWNAWRKEDQAAPGDLQVDLGVFNPLLGVSYGEMAAESRSMHKSQGFGTAPVHGTDPDLFASLGGSPGTSLFDGVDLSWARVPHSGKVAEAIARALKGFRADKPSAAVPALIDALAALRRLPRDAWTEPKERELLEAIAACSGLFLESAAAQFSTLPGEHLDVTVTALNRGPLPWTLREVRFRPGGAIKREKPVPLTTSTAPLKGQLAVPIDARLSNPYWLELLPEAGVWRVDDPRWLGLAEQPPTLLTELELELNGHVVTIVRPVELKWTEPVSGERTRPVEILPPVSLTPSSDQLLFADPREQVLRVKLTANRDHVKGTLRAPAPQGWIVEPAQTPFAIEKRGGELSIELHVRGRARPSPATMLEFAAEVDGQSYSRGLVRVSYPHIPIQTVQPEMKVKLVRLELARGGNRIGYIPGAGDDVATALRQVGYEVTILSDEALASAPLERFDAIVVGIRAYNVNPRLPAHHRRLMEYVSQGGTLVAQYNTYNRLSTVPDDIGPWPFNISRDRVTDETAAVSFTPATHPVLLKPNAITPDDFSGWIQERGLYFADKWDAHYETPLSMHDPNEPARQGSLLIARFGKGAFIYTGLAFFRQLPAGVPGAFRLFANLLAYGH